MAKKVKKSLSLSQKYRRYKVVEKLSLYSEFVSVGLPYVIMGAVNFDTWFKKAGGWKVGLGGALGMVMMGIAVLAIAKGKENKSKTNGYITLLLSWLAAATIFLLLREIMDQIAQIMYFGAIGIAGALGLEINSKNFKAKAEVIKESKKEVVKKTYEEEIQQENLEKAEKRQKRKERIEESRRRAVE